MSSILCLQFYSFNASVNTPSNFYHCCSVVNVKVKDGDSRRSSLIVENIFDILDILWVQVNWRISLSIFVKNLSWNFDGYCIESVDCFGRWPF